MPDSQKEPPAGGPEPQGPPGLVFKPDEKRLARIALLRRLMLWITLAIVGVGLVLLIRYRPRPVRGPARLPDAVVPSPVGSDSLGAGAAPGVSGTGAGRDQARLEVDRIRAAVRSTADRWRRARPLVPAQTITGENGADVLKQVATALAMLDSAGNELAQAQNSARRLGELVRGREALEAYRLSVLYAAALDLMKQLEDEAGDQSALFGSLAAACRAALDGNQAEAAIKQDVATSHLRRSEARQRRLGRLSDAFEASAARHFR